MKGLPVEVALLTFLLVFFVFIILVAPWVRASDLASSEFVKWGALVLGALLATLTGRRNRNN